MPGNPVSSFFVLVLISLVTGSFALPCEATPTGPVAGSTMVGELSEFALGQQSTERKHFTSAVKHFDNAVRAEPSNIRYHYARGMAQLGLRDADGALADFQFCQKADPKFVIPAKQWAAAYRACGQSKLAIDCWTKALAEEPKRTIYDIYYQRAQTFVEADRYEEAIADYTSAIALQPHIEDFPFQRATCYVALKQFQKALPYYSARLKKDPFDDNCLVHRAACQMGLGHYKECIADYSAAIALKPRMAKYYALRAKAFESMGNRPLAAKDRDKSRELGEDFRL
jgi:tetratricopeptide (TPR) repeat protein